MLSIAGGVRLIVLLGTVPLPASADLMHALRSVQVQCDARTGDGFQLSFTIGKDTPLDYGLLVKGALAPMTRVIVGIIFGIMPEPLIDGVITRHDVSASDEPGKSTLTVTGKDLAYVMSLQEKNASFENQPDSIIFTRLIGAYAQYGLVPQPSPTTGMPVSVFRTPRQAEDDLTFVRRMAARNGYVFYIEPLTIGASVAYMGPENRASIPQPALTTNIGGHNTVRSGLRFSLDADAPVGAQGTFIEPTTKMKLPIPPLPSLKIPPLAVRPVAPNRRRLMRRTANQQPQDAALAMLSEAMNAPDAVTCTGEIDVVAYGHALRPRHLVGVRGAGFTYDGDYYVRSVVHTIAPGASYSQSFTLTREGTGALLPVVLP